YSYNRTLGTIPVSSTFGLLRRAQLFGRFPYATLFRSRLRELSDRLRGDASHRWRQYRLPEAVVLHRDRWQRVCPGCQRHSGRARSEEHTSELQSRENLVCRLRLEKKDKR